jgi:DDE superfamily endonuclease
MTGRRFLAYVERCLASTLKRNEIVMIDNLPAHKAVGVREATDARGATLRYLPKYSPTWTDRDVLHQAEGLSARGRRTDNPSPAPPHWRMREACGDFYVLDYRSNAITTKGVDPEAYGREIGALQAWERVVSWAKSPGLNMLCCRRKRSVYERFFFSLPELKDSLLAAVDYFNRDPVVHAWTYMLDNHDMILTSKSLG